MGISKLTRDDIERMDLEEARECFDALGEVATANSRDLTKVHHV